MAGPTIELPSVALRSANLRLQGNGQGAVSTQAYLAELPSLVDEINAGTIGVDPRTVPLADVEAVWVGRTCPASGRCSSRSQPGDRLSTVPVIAFHEFTSRAPFPCAAR